MAKIGLDMGEKLPIAGKNYRVVDGLKLDDVLGKLTYRSNEGPVTVYEDDTSQPRRQDGSYPQIPTGEVQGTVLGIHSSVQHETLFVTVTDMAGSDIEALDLKYREAVELDNPVMTYSSVNGNDNYKLFASGIKKAGGQAKPAPAPAGKPDDKK